jgi:hypothetical protein
MGHSNRTLRAAQGVGFTQGVAAQAGWTAAQLVDVSAIAARLGTSRGMIHQWRLRNVGFPDPLVTLAIGPVWLWPDVERWAAARRPNGRPPRSPRVAAAEGPAR